MPVLLLGQVWDLVLTKTRKQLPELAFTLAPTAMEILLQEVYCFAVLVFAKDRNEWRDQTQIESTALPLQKTFAPSQNRLAGFFAMVLVLTKTRIQLPEPAFTLAPTAMEILLQEVYCFVVLVFAKDLMNGGTKPR